MLSMPLSYASEIHHSIGVFEITDGRKPTVDRVSSRAGPHRRPARPRPEIERDADDRAAADGALRDLAARFDGKGHVQAAPRHRPRAAAE